MAKARTLLGLLLLSLTVVGVVLWQSDIQQVNKLLWSIPLTLLYLTGGILLLVTFFALDEEGRIPRGSLIYQYLNWMELRADESTRICPLFWQVLIGLVLGVVILGFVSFFVWIIVWGILGGYTQREWRIWILVIGGVLIYLVYVKAVIAILHKLHDMVEDKIPTFLEVAGSVFLMVLFIFSPFAFAIKFFGEELSLFWSIVFALKVAGLFTLGIGVIVGLVFLTVCLLSVFVPFIKNTVLGIVMAGLYEKFCPIIPIAPGK